MIHQTVDVGGTWIRVQDDRGLRRFASPSRLLHPNLPQAKLLNDLIETLAAQAPAKGNVAISLGAAMDDETGVVYGSGPMWSGEVPDNLNLKLQLAQRRPDVQWFVTNDLTAALASFVSNFASPEHRRATYITVSSGIALRTADLSRMVVPVDSRGLQGEVGHLLASSSYPLLRGLRCACGSTGHIAAIGSGPALLPVARALHIDEPEVVCSQLEKRVLDEDEDAKRLLAAIVEPLAELVRTLLCLDPRIDLVGLGGGVVEGLARCYEAELVRQLSATTSYADVGGVGNVDEIRNKLRICRAGDVDPGEGATAMATNFLKCEK